MPKLKNHKGVSKRFKVSGTGKVRYKRAGKRHLLTSKNRGRKRKLKKSGTATGIEARMLKRLMSMA